MLQPDCPCGSQATYDACCGRLHRGAVQALTAEELMRSRYCAYALGGKSSWDHLFRTWHPRTRPEDVTGIGATGMRWTGLEILEVVGGRDGDTTGIVEFEASFTTSYGSGGADSLRERSTFARRGRRWVYVGPEQARD